MKKIEVWKDRHKGIFFEIKLNGVGGYRPEGTYCAYILIYKKNIPKQFNKLLVTSEEMEPPFSKRRYWKYSDLNDYFDMHCGLSYYELIRDEFTGKPIGVKVGCDYAHLHDDYVYFEGVLSDTERSIDTFLTHFPECVVWDQQDGEYRKYESLIIKSP